LSFFVLFCFVFVSYLTLDLQECDSQELCCNNTTCKWRPAGLLCRNSTGAVCDAADLCSGTSDICVGIFSYFLLYLYLLIPHILCCLSQLHIIIFRLLKDSGQSPGFYCSNPTGICAVPQVHLKIIIVISRVHMCSICVVCTCVCLCDSY
jgi:hypothetical protein